MTRGVCLCLHKLNSFPIPLSLIILSATVSTFSHASSWYFGGKSCLGVCIRPVCHCWMSCVCFLVSTCSKGHLARFRVLASQGQGREVEAQCLHPAAAVGAIGPHPISQILNHTELWKPQVSPFVTKSLENLNQTDLRLFVCIYHGGMNIHKPHCRGINMFDYSCCPTGLLHNV